MIQLNKDHFLYIRDCADQAILEVEDLRKLDNLLEAFEPNPAVCIELFEDTAERYPDYGEMAFFKFKSVYYEMLAAKFQVVFLNRAKVAAEDALMYQNKYIEHLKLRYFSRMIKETKSLDEAFPEPHHEEAEGGLGDGKF